MIYENREDRKKQSEAVSVLQGAWNDFNLIETKEVYRLNHDFSIYKGSVTHGVGEIKCRDYDMEFFKKNPWLIERERVVSLHSNSQSRGIPVVFVLYTKDKHVLQVSMKKIMEELSSLEKAPDHMMKDNHGKQLADKSGILIPFEMLVYVGKYTEDETLTNINKYIGER